MFMFLLRKAWEAYVCSDITGYVIINRFIAIPLWDLLLYQMCELCTLRIDIISIWSHSELEKVVV